MQLDLRHSSSSPLVYTALLSSISDASTGSNAHEKGNPLLEVFFDISSSFVLSFSHLNHKCICLHEELVL